MQRGISSFSRLERFLFSSRPEENTTPLQTRISIVSLYVVLVGSFVVIPLNAPADLRAGLVGIAIAQGVFFLLTVSSVISFWITRKLVVSRWLVSVAVFAIVVHLIISGGGVRGLGLLYFVAGYPVLYHLVGYLSGIGLPVLIFVGTLIRHQFGNYHRESYFNDPTFVPLYLTLLGVSSALAIVAVIYQRRMLRSLTTAAYSDPVTGLANRRSFDETLSAITSGKQSYASRFSVLAIRLRRFSRINSHHGTSRADEILAELSRRLLAESPDNVIIARYTGTVFMVLTTCHDEAEVEGFARTLLRSVHRSFHVGDTSATLRAQIAITRYPEDAQKSQRLLANVATMVSRMTDRDTTISHFNEVSFHAERQEQRIGERLREAIARDELSLAYHPRVRIADQSVHGAEVLLRWKSPELGTVSPGVFIPLAEDLGYIRTITRWVMDQAARELGTLGEAGAQLLHSINLSPTDVSAPDFSDTVTRWQREFSIDPGRIEFEITEGVAIDGYPRVHEHLHWLRAQGFGLAIDDFGTGYSNLRYLNELQLTTVKIDQSFIRQIVDADSETALLTAIISMSRSLGLEVIAEGVETTVQAQQILQAGCENAQGYLYHKPLALQEYRSLLTRSAIA